MGDSRNPRRKAPCRTVTTATEHQRFGFLFYESIVEKCIGNEWCEMCVATQINRTLSKKTWINGLSMNVLMCDMQELHIMFR